MKKTKKRPKSFGRGFDILLRDCEEWEDFFEGRTKKAGTEFSINNDLFTLKEDQQDVLKYTIDMAENSWRLRNAFKFKMDFEKDIPGVDIVARDAALTTPMSPPFEQCVFLAENWGDGIDLLMLLDQRTADHINDTPEMLEAYTDHGILTGEQIISIMPVLYRPDGLIDVDTGVREASRKLSYLPAEIHFALHKTLDEGNSGLGATPKFAIAKGQMWRDLQMQITAAAYMMIYLLSLHKPVRQPGRPPHTKKMKPQLGKHVLYEHHTLEIDPFQVPPVAGGGSRPHGSPRLHAVRGFWRQYKSGKRVWVHPHWRGDKDKGVVTKDYSIVPEHGERSG